MASGRVPNTVSIVAGFMDPGYRMEAGVPPRTAIIWPMTTPQEPNDELDLEKVLDELRQRVQQRRDSGELPAQLEHDLDVHFRTIAPRLGTRPKIAKHLLEDLEEAIKFDRRRIGTGSEASGGSAVHRLVAKLVARQTDGILEQVSEFARVTRSLMLSIVEVVESLSIEVNREVEGQIQVLMEKAAATEAALNKIAHLQDLDRA